MPNLYAQQMVDMLKQVGQPIVTKQTGTTSGTTTTTANQNEGMDLGMLMSLLMLMMNKNKLPATSEVANAPIPSSRSLPGVSYPLPTPSIPGEESGTYPGAGTGNASPDLTNALSGIALSGYLGQNKNLVAPGSQLATGTNPMARMTPADILKIILGMNG